MSYWKVRIELTEPFACAEEPAVSNDISTTDFIPATTLRGALYSAVRTRDAGWTPGQAEALFGRGGPRYSPAWPLDPEQRTCVPAPLSFRRDKSDSSDFDGSFGVFNTLACRPANLPSELGQHRHQWTRLKRNWVVLDSDFRAARSFDLSPDTTMHVGTHYGRGSVRGSALFSRQVVPAGTLFQAFIYDPQGVIQNPPTGVFLGKRVSAGFGSARLHWESVSCWPFPSESIAENECYVQLLSDAILPCMETGGYRLGPTASDFEGMFGSGVEVLHSETATRLPSGWNTFWRASKGGVPAVRAGSAFRLRCDTIPTTSVGFIGIRNHEGFGWLAINPPWLATGPAAQFGEPVSRSNEELSAVPWPGIDTDSRRLEYLLELAKEASRKDFGANRQARVRDLASYSRDCRDSIEFWFEVDRRFKRKQWSRICSELQKTTFGLTIEEIRFFMEALSLDN